MTGSVRPLFLATALPDHPGYAAVRPELLGFYAAALLNYPYAMPDLDALLAPFRPRPDDVLIDASSVAALLDIIHMIG